jgi:hypothetical protein
MPLLQRASIRLPPSCGAFISILLLVAVDYNCIVWNDSSLVSVQALSIFSIPGTPVRMATVQRKTTLQYGRNMEIWPPVGANDAIQIQDSFPHGLVVPSLPDPRGIVHRVNSWCQRRVGDPLSSVDDAAKADMSSLWLTVVIWIATLQTGAVRPIDLLTAAGLTGYFAIWQQQWTRSSSNPPLNKGPVPYTVRFPLGYQLTHSRLLRNWKQIGRILDQVIPILLLVLIRTTRTPAEAAFVPHSFYSWMTRALFFSASQAFIVYLSDRTTTGVRNIPLPIRGFLPVVYCSVRLLYLWQWVCTVYQPRAIPFIQNVAVSTIVGTLFRLLPLVQMVYGSAHMLGFLIPVALVRYMRVYFYMVEAQEVQLRTSPSTLY